jgi:hypothetical protein
VAVDGTPWLASHRGATLRACLDRTCASISSSGEPPDGTHLYPAVGRSEETVTVTIVGRRDGRVLLDTSIRAQIRRHKLVTGPCGTVYESWARLTVTTTGQIRA